MLLTAGDAPHKELRDFARLRASGVLPARWVWKAPREPAEPEQGSLLGHRVEPEVEKTPVYKGNCVSCVTAA